jgi:hypothetical protein
MRYLLALLCLASSAQAAVVLNVGVGRDLLIGEQFERVAKVGYAIPVFEGFAIRPEVAGDVVRAQGAGTTDQNSTTGSFLDIIKMNW